MLYYVVRCSLQSFNILVIENLYHCKKLINLKNFIKLNQKLFKVMKCSLHLFNIPVIGNIYHAKYHLNTNFCFKCYLVQ